jgi:hypothetical protein
LPAIATLLRQVLRNARQPWLFRRRVTAVEFTRRALMRINADILAQLNEQPNEVLDEFLTGS